MESFSLCLLLDYLCQLLIKGKWARDGLIKWAGAFKIDIISCFAMIRGRDQMNLNRQQLFRVDRIENQQKKR